MKFDSEKKQAIKLYILEKIAAKATGISASAAQAFGISTNTAHTYLKELQEAGIIEREQRGRYRLAAETFVYQMRRSAGDLDSDTHAFDVCLSKHIAELPPNVKQIWSYAFSEMVNNVMDHSGAELMEICVTVNYLETSVSIHDNGVGIFEKIKRHFSLPSLDEAICELFKGKLTTDSENHSGEGIFFTSRMMDTFLILSDRKIFTTTKYQNDHILDIGEDTAGTAVFMSLSNFTHKTAREVFDLYANVDGGFMKTRIPLKSIFDSAPVSRSQAKRICNRLDEFEEVILDFDGIGWMGQGFAHQLFVVYRREHPEITLIPEGMNESVLSMYRHVTKTV